MERLLIVFTYYAIFILVMVNQNNGKETKVYRYDIDGSDPVEISPSEPVTLIPGQVWIFQKTEYIIDKNWNVELTGSIHLWIGQNSPRESRLKGAEIFANVIENTREMCRSLESIQLFREVQGFESEIFMEMINFLGNQQRNESTSISPHIGPRPKLFKIKVTPDDIIVRRVQIDNTEINEEYALVLLCPLGIFMFLGNRTSPEERQTANIFSTYIRSLDSINYKLQNRELNIIDRTAMEHYINFYNPLESPLSDPILYTIASHFFTPSELRGNKKFIQGRYEHVWLFEWHLEDGIYWEKSPKLLQERNREDGIYLDLENSPILLRELFSKDFGLIDFEEETIFIHISRNPLIQNIKELFKIAESIEWLQKDLTKLSIIQGQKYTAEFLIHFFGMEKMKYMMNRT